MPGGDKRGPMGEGPMTGRSVGFCTGNEVPGYMNQTVYGADRGAGFGRKRARGCASFRHVPGRGRRYNDAQPVSAEQEAELLRNQAIQLNGQLEQVNKRLKELEKTGEK